jgi:alpha-L-fucosidase
LNVGPTPEGLIPQPCIDHLMEVGIWMETNGEAIYGTSPWLVSHDGAAAGDPPVDIRFTAKGNSLYAICLSWPDAEVLVRKLGKQELAGRTIGSIRMLGSNERIDWQQTGEGLKLGVPREKPGKYAVVYRIDFNKP